MKAGTRVLQGAAIAAVVGIVLTAFAADPASEEELYRKGMASFKQKSFRPAATAFEELLKRFPASARAREVQFHAAVRSGVDVSHGRGSV